MLVPVYECYIPHERISMVSAACNWKHERIRQDAGVLGTYAAVAGGTPRRVNLTVPGFVAQASMRVAVYGAKHDAVMFEELLKDYCVLDPEHTLGSAMIDTACLGTPKVPPLALL